METEEQIKINIEGLKNQIKEENKKLEEIRKKSKISPSGSFKGYNFFIWLKLNKNLVKGILVAGVTVAVFLNPNLNTTASAILAALGGTATKLVTDGFDYYVSNVDNSKNE